MSAPKKLRYSFMTGAQFREIRETKLRVSQQKLANQLIYPVTGQPIVVNTIYRWEKGQRAIPQWAARVINAMVEAANEHDSYVERKEV